MVKEEKVLSFWKGRKVYSLANVMEVVTYFIMVQKKCIHSLMLGGRNSKNKRC